MDPKKRCGSNYKGDVGFGTVQRSSSFGYDAKLIDYLSL